MCAGKPFSTPTTSLTAWPKRFNVTEERRAIQQAYNEAHGITPKSIISRSNNSILAFLEISRRLNTQQLDEAYEQVEDIPMESIPELIAQLEAQMKESAKKNGV